MSIYRAYDIRGIYPEQINPELGKKIGFMFGKMIKEGLLKGKIIQKPRIVVGADGRIGSKDVRESVIEGLISAGVHVIDIGHIPVPVLYFATVTLESDGGLMVSGSHNPKEYLGFKFCGRGAEPIGYDDGINLIEEFCNSGKEIVLENGGSKEEKDMSEEYINFVAGKMSLSKQLHVVVDGGNGISGPTVKKLLEKVGCKVDCICYEPDGNFPNHEPDPSKKANLDDLQKKVVELKADFGLAFDGDGDRIGFVNHDGKIVANEFIFSLLVEDALKNTPGSKIVFDMLHSQLVEDVVERNGGELVACKVGYPFVRKTMKKENAILSGEISGHFYFSESFGYDDAMFAGVKTLDVLCNNDLDKFIETLPKYVIKEDVRIPCDDEKKFFVAEEIKKHFQKQNAKISDLDGVKLFFDKGWGAIRPSNTTPFIVIRWEATDQESYDKIGKLLIDTVNDFISK